MESLDRNIPDETLHILLAKSIAGEADLQEEAEVLLWVARSEVNRQYVDELRLICIESGNMGFDGEVDVMGALDRFRMRVAREGVLRLGLLEEERLAGVGKNGTALDRRVGEGVLESLRRRGVVRALWWAAAVLILVVAGVFLFRGSGHLSRKGEVQVAAAAETILVDTLMDGSVVRLHPHAFYGYKDRRLSLHGDAEFVVARDPGKPFRVAVNGVEVTVLGTSFSIRNVTGGTEIAVSTGAVEVVKGEQRMKLLAHERVVVPVGGEVWEKMVDSSGMLNAMGLTGAAASGKDTLPEKKDTIESAREEMRAIEEREKQAKIEAVKAKQERVEAVQKEKQAAEEAKQRAKQEAVEAKQREAEEVKHDSLTIRKDLEEAKQEEGKMDSLKKRLIWHDSEDGEKALTVMKSILAEIVAEKIVPDKDSLSWVALDGAVFIVNDRRQSEELHWKFKEKFRAGSNIGYYYGPVKITATGYFFDSNDIDKKE